MVVYYRKLNENMEPVRFPLPRAETIFNTLETPTYFSLMYISQTFFQQPKIPEDMGYTAFVTQGVISVHQIADMNAQFLELVQYSMNSLFAGLLYQGIFMWMTW